VSEGLQLALALLLGAAALPVAIGAGYLLLLTLRARPGVPPATPPPGRVRFDIIVPAHNEAVGISSTVKNLLALDYPSKAFRVMVVADNCSDTTAQLARAAGATVLERTDATLRGKGYALAYAFAQSLADGAADAVVVVDADTHVSPNLLSAFSARLGRGALAAQAHYGVLNPGASWRTRLMTIALSAFHQVRGLGRESLGVSCGLRGNGMCFRHALLRWVPHDAYSLVEDLEYGIRLGRKGYRVEYVWEAEVLGEMVSGEQASRSQRHRWEHGRTQMRRQHGWPLFRDGLTRGSALLLDLAFDVLVPPLAQLTVAAVGVTVLGVLAQVLANAGVPAMALGGFSVWCIGLYVLGGWWHSRTGLRGLVDLAFAPAYVGWKLMLAFKKKKPAATTGATATAAEGEWVRTTREGETRP
jgi:1,2-diacylglycerol 3-beta-glucosyltransferase